jgi:signal transduction histidine kinase
VTKPRVRVLLVEDSPDDEMLMRAELRRQGLEFELRRVETSAQLIDALREPWDVALADYTLPSFSATEALAVVNESGQDVPLIVVSGSVGEEVAINAMKAGAADYFRKDNITRLVPAIYREIAEKANRDEKRVLASQLEEALTTERRLRAQAEDANRMKDEFLAVLSHELRTPLNAILGWTYLLQQGPKDAETARRAIATIERNAQFQAKLIDDLLDTSRIIAGKLSLEYTTVDLAQVVQQAVDAIRPLADAKHLALATDIARVPPLSADPHRLLQVAGNVLSNAVKFTSAGGTIHVRVAACDGNAIVKVQDTGQGIDPEFLPHIFDAFRQADQTRTRRYGGLGLGLAIAHRLIALHGGKLSATSVGAGQGSTFTIALPVDAGARPVPHATAARTAPMLSGARVLVVDDDTDSRELVADLIAATGADVRTAPEAQEAMRVLSEWNPEILLCDIGMPEMDGYELMRTVRRWPHEHGGDVRAIAVTAYASAEDRRRAEAAGFQLHMSKPLRPERLLDAMVGLLGRR